MTPDLLLTPPPAGAADAKRTNAISRILDAPRLPTPPAVAMRIVQATARPDSTAREIGDLLQQDPALCGQVLKAINSCVYALSEPVMSVERAVLLLGLNTVRSIVLTLSLPAMQFQSVADRVIRDHWLSSVSGAIIARELAVRLRLPNAEDDLLCGLLRDLGALVLRQVFPDDYERFHVGMATRPFSQLCRYEREVFGVDHADVSAELLRRWRLPDAIWRPIRYHHEPGRESGTDPSLIARARRLAFVEALTNLDVVAHQPAELEALLKVADADYGLSKTAVVEFLQEVMPRVEAFTQLLSIDVGRCPDFAATLAGGCNELLSLTAQSGRVGMEATARTPAPPPPVVDEQVGATVLCSRPIPLPDFAPEFLDHFPETGCYLDGYELLQLVGRGAMGAVFRAWEPSLDRVVAIKMMAPEEAEDTQYQQRFLREARNAAAIRHENVVSIYAVKEAGAQSYLSMEFVEGQSLESLVDDGRSFDVPALRDVASQVAAGLAAAHRARVIHRDVKPANILIETATGRAKLTDFGLARAESDVRLTADGGLVGTPLYMSPEQAAGQPLDARSDLFSLGSVLYTAATGRPPFDSRAMFQVLRMVIEATPTPPRQLRPELPGWLDALILKLLAKRPEDRYQSAAEVVEFLKDPAAATPPKRRGWWPFAGR